MSADQPPLPGPWPISAMPRADSASRREKPLTSPTPSPHQGRTGLWVVSPLCTTPAPPRPAASPWAARPPPHHTPLHPPPYSLLSPPLGSGGPAGICKLADRARTRIMCYTHADVLGQDDLARVLIWTERSYGPAPGAAPRPGGGDHFGPPTIVGVSVSLACLSHSFNLFYIYSGIFFLRGWA